MSARRRASTRAMKAIRPVIYERSGGDCERCCTPVRFEDFDAHHRKLRRRGGDDSAENLMVCCPPCHKWIHDNPAEATHLGYMVPSWADPKDIPIGRLETAL